MTILSVATVLKCLDEARDQDSKYRDQDQDQDSKNAVSRLSRDETVSRGFPSLTLRCGEAVYLPRRNMQ